MTREVGQGPTVALRVQHDLERWWRTPMARKFAHTFDGSMEATLNQEGRGLGSTRAKMQQGRGGNVEAMIHQQRMLRTAPTYSVTSDMLTLTEAAAMEFPGQALYAEDLPTPTGFVLFDRSIDMLDIHEKPVSMRAFSWQPVEVQRVEGGEVGPGIFLAMYSDLGDVVNYDAEELAKDTVPGAAKLAWENAAYDELWENAERVFGCGLALLHVHGILLGHEYDLGLVRVLQNHLAFVESLLAIMQQRIAVVAHHDVPRQLRRGIQRTTGVLPEVRVVTLRRAKAHTPDDGEGPGFVEWSHRWLVTGHWRRTWNEKLHRERLTWINPYVKGPEDKPLVVKDTVYRLSR